MYGGESARNREIERTAAYRRANIKTAKYALANSRGEDEDTNAFVNY